MLIGHWLTDKGVKRPSQPLMKEKVFPTQIPHRNISYSAIPSASRSFSPFTHPSSQKKSHSTGDGNSSLLPEPSSLPQPLSLRDEDLHLP